MTGSTRALWLAVIIVFSLMVGAAAGVLIWMSTRDPIRGIFTGAASFAGTVVLLLAMAAFLSPDPKRP
ncbi:hypothetical protein [Micromonospora sp. IBSANI012]|uniref:hypothetical protein n=1 Tax=Micromonospora sp. IBSANI012 TaxID=3457761 RepID=UPI0040587EAB